VASTTAALDTVQPSNFFDALEHAAHDIAASFAFTVVNNPQALLISAPAVMVAPSTLTVYDPLSGISRHRLGEQLVRELTQIPLVEGRDISNNRANGNRETNNDRARESAGLERRVLVSG
jgi:hypothetical protein